MPAGAVDERTHERTGFAYMHDDGQVERPRQRELRKERGLLCLSRSAAARQVDSDLADRDDVFVARQTIHHAGHRITP